MRAILFGLGLFVLVVPAFAQDMRPLPRPAPGQPGGETLVISSKSPTPRPPYLAEGFEMRLALSAARRGEWDLAAGIAAADSEIAADVVEWLRLRSAEGGGGFAEYRAFLERNPTWPGLDLLRRRGEAAIPEGSAAGQVIAYFADRLPQTGTGALRLAAALAGTGKAREARRELVRAWQTLSMSAEEEAAFLAAHGDVVKPHHAARLDNALWREDIAAARRMLPLVGEDWRALAEARLALQRRAGNVDALIAAVPAQLAQDPGLAYDRMRWQVSKRRREQAADMILARSTSAESLGRPASWANWRRILARQNMREGNAARAYALASGHRLTSGSDYADLEWLSGYLALRFLDKPAEAYAHFQRFRAAVFTPISLGRAGYWEGRALDALGRSAAANAAYRDAAQYQTSFYGQLAAERAGVDTDPALTGSGDIAAWEEAGFARTSLFQAAGLFLRVGELWETVRFLSRLSDITAREELVALSDYTLSLNEPYLAVRVGKRIAGAGVVAPRAYYPLTRLGGGDLPVSEELALSIARRESEFYAAAVSGAGARGLMQLMPATAKQMAGELGVDYERARLTSDPVYNATLGSAYLAQLIEEFGDNIVLVSVAYNAGPSRARSWIEDFGDPRAADVDVVDWIEHIPFRETRNYVMRVAESLPVYRARLTGEVEPLGLLADLKKR